MHADGISAIQAEAVDLTYVAPVLACLALQLPVGGELTCDRLGRELPTLLKGEQGIVFTQYAIIHID